MFSGPQQSAADRKASSFEPSTVRLLETWYAANIRHPYPDDVTLAALATGGGISVKQVRKWLANRRVRTGNTLTYNGAVHPRRLRRIRRQRQRQSVDTDSVEPVVPRHSTPIPTAAVGPSPSAELRVPPSAGSFYDGAFQTSTPFSGAFRLRGDHFEVDSTVGRNSTTVRHHPYITSGRVTSISRAEMWMTPMMHRSAYFTAPAAEASNYALIRQMAYRQFNV